MTGEELVGFIIVLVIAIPLIIISIVLMTGRGGDFVAGLNTMKHAEREKYDEKAICKCVGRFTLPAGLLMPTIVFGVIFIAYTVIGSVVVLVRLNTDKFKR